MIFSSVEFLLFLIFSFLFYWFVFQKNLKAQNIFLLVISYFFYGWWNWHFLALIFVSSIIDYILGIQLGKDKSNRTRKILITISIIANLGVLGFFKYFNFFIDSFIDLLSIFGMRANISTLSIILPIGISFYTFQTLSYSIDVYRRKLEPTKDIVAFFTFVSFFPQLVAGPIEKAKNLLPQFTSKRHFDNKAATDGLKQILIGLFKKIVVADTASVMVDAIHAQHETLTGFTLFLGTFLFAFQMYGDFSGYSDIAIGTSRLFGFSLRRNFAYPYFSRDIAEYWRRWHMSLTSWFRDYLYIPLGGSKVNKAKQIRNVFIIFLVSGLWHGASWTFVVWGAINALYFLPLLLRKTNRKNIEIVAKIKSFPSLLEFKDIIITFLLTSFVRVFFRSQTISEAYVYLKNMLTKFNNPIKELHSLNIHLKELSLVLFFIAALIVIEWVNRNKEHGLDMQTSSKLIKYGVYYSLTFLVLYYFNANSVRPFIYFQF